MICKISRFQIFGMEIKYIYKYIHLIHTHTIFAFHDLWFYLHFFVQLSPSGHKHTYNETEALTGSWKVQKNNCLSFHPSVPVLKIGGNSCHHLLIVRLKAYRLIFACRNWIQLRTNECLNTKLTKLPFINLMPGLSQQDNTSKLLGCF